MNQKGDWNPELYLKFGNERTQPSIDLVNRINIDFEPQTILDIGCGPGNSTQVLSARWPSADISGLDNSQSMIEKAKKEYPHQRWIFGDAASFESDTSYDIVFSNATIQWVPNHERLFQRFSHLLSDRGVVAVQMPLFYEMKIGKILRTISTSAPWNADLEHCSNVFTFHDYRYYFDVLSAHCSGIQLWETDYYHILDTHKSILDFIQGAGLRPYLDKLNDENRKSEFAKEVLKEIRNEYPLQNNGKVIFPFKRLFMIAQK